ncbi:hypothetical protein ACVW0P_004513 [Mucilaginibacter sp. UYNi724]
MTSVISNSDRQSMYLYSFYKGGYGKRIKTEYEIQPKKR